MNISGNTIFITGATSGIGRALAEALHAKQNTVIIAGRRQALLDEVTSPHPGMKGIRLDVTDSKSIDQCVAELKKSHPKLNVVINNAGIARQEDFTKDNVDLETAMSILQTNLISVVQLTGKLLPLLRAQPKSTLITTTSGLAFVPLPRSPTYCATKAFLHNWLESLRVQLQKTSVEVLELAPPYVQTQLGGPEQQEDSRAVPLKTFIGEVMKILETKSYQKGEILVEQVGFFRWAEKTGTYDEALKTLSSF